MQSPEPRRIPLWVDLRHVAVNKRRGMLSAAKENGATLLLDAGDTHADRDGLRAVTVDDNQLAGQRVGDEEPVTGQLVTVNTVEDQERAAAEPGVVVVDGQDWTIIPLENLIAARRDRPDTLYALARSQGDVELFATTLEVGVHGIVLAPTEAKEIGAAAAYLDRRAGGAGSIPLQHATITRIEDAGEGDRVCIDTTSLFRDGEGLLVGSTARAMTLVHAETIEAGYVRARPFRVNAGAVHCYVMAPGGRTRYLSELAAGDRVLAVDRDGRQRALTVGRAKIERRPHTLVEWEGETGRASVMLQTAETIRLIRTDGTVVAVTELAVGDEVFIHTETSARHFGMPVDEFLEEK